MYLTAIIILFLLLCFSTILDELRLRQIERARRKAETSVAKKSGLIATLSHEIRNPLTGVLSVLQLLGNSVLDENQRRLINNAGDSSHDLLSLLDGTLEQSRLEAGSEKIRRDVFMLDDIIQPLLVRFSCRARDKGIMLVSHTSPSVQQQCCGDAGKIRQILCNLLSNAIRFTDSGIIKLHIGDEMHTDGKTMMFFRVIDSGIGIPATSLQQVFEPYRQAGNVQSRFGGTGLGLAISRTLARAMDGDIHVQSCEGRGSIFSLLLPLAQPTEPATGQQPGLMETAEFLPAPPDKIQTSLRILVIDDSEMHCLAAQAMLENLGHHVAIATCATEAFAMLRWQAFDAVFVDMHLPDMDGLQVIRHIHDKITHDKPSPYIIAVSAWLDSNDVTALMDNGANAACTKPLDRNALQQMLAALPATTRLATTQLATTQRADVALPPRRGTRIS